MTIIYVVVGGDDYNDDDGANYCGDSGGGDDVDSIDASVTLTAADTVVFLSIGNGLQQALTDD